MRRLVSGAVICVWVVMLVLLVRRAWVPSTRSEPLPHRAITTKDDQWMGIYQQDQKIGYTHSSLTPDGEGLLFSESSLLRLSVLDTPQTVRTSMRGHLSPDFALRDIEFELSSGVGNLQASAVVTGPQLRLTLRTGADVTEQVIPLEQPLYLPSPLRATLAGHSMQPGRVVEALVFDPTALKNDRMRITVAGREQVPGGTGQAWRVTEEFRGVETTAWLNEDGAVLREEGPMGFILIRQSAEQAVAQGWETQAVLDIVARAAVPVARPIADARDRMTLRVRLSGVNVDDVPTDTDQERDGAVVTITRPALSRLQSYEIPFAGGHLTDELRPTPFLQSDHPRIHAAAQAALGREHDALRAVVRLNDWVYATLRKVPTISLPNALQVLEMGEGDCNEHAVLLAALARSAGIPTRVVAGAVYLDGVFLYHAWCEVWLGRWVAVDPAFHQFPADATHIKFVVGGPESHLAMLSVIGRLRIDVLDERG